LFAAGAGAQPQHEPPNGVLLVAKPGLADPNFRETVVLASQTPDGSTVGVILNRPTQAKHEKSGDALGFGGPVMREVVVALFRSERAPEVAAFHVLKGIYLTMHPAGIERLVENAPGPRLFAVFGMGAWQLESELARDDGPASASRAPVSARTLRPVGRARDKSPRRVAMPERNGTRLNETALV
jgi:putative transcriptional regulator